MADIVSEITELLEDLEREKKGLLSEAKELVNNPQASLEEINSFIKRTIAHIEKYEQLNKVITTLLAR